MHIGFASVAAIDQIWPMIATDMQGACERVGSEYTAGELWQMCRSGNGFLLIVADENLLLMASVWRFIGKEFHCVMMWGKDRKVWLSTARDFIETTAKNNGSLKLVAEGRSGWLRIFKDAVMNGEKYEVHLHGR